MTTLNSSIARGSFAITTNDTTLLTKKAFGIYCNGTAGTVSYLADDGTSDSITIAVGQTWPVVITRVNTTGTTATGLKGFTLWVP